MSPRAASWAWRGLALLAGAAAALAHPPFGLLAGLLGYAVLLRASDTDGPRPLRSAFLRGWLAGLGYFAVGVWWVAEAFLVDAATYGWMAPFALALLAGGLALFWGAACALYRGLTGGRRELARVLVFAGCLTALEWARGHLLTGFPWNLPGETWRAGSAMSQGAAVVGAYGMSWLTVALAGAPAVLFDAASRMRRAAALGVAVVALGGLWLWGDLRLAAAPSAAPGAPRVRLVQANIDQKDKWRPENLEQIFQTYVALTERPSATPVDVVIWPEGALPVVIDDFLAPGSPYVARLSAALKPGQTLLLGANRAGPGRGGEIEYFNSLIAVRAAPAGQIAVGGVYDKFRLVPFGEFLPLGPLATRLGVRSLVHMPGDFTAGPPPRPLSVPGLPPFQPLICYEALFPRLTAGAGRPAWIVNVSNDAWFGATSGPWQHLNLASYRAIEQGLPIARATPTGVSAMIDAQGRVVGGERLGLGGFGVIDAPLPRALAPTPFSRFGELGLVLMLAASGAATFRVRRKAPQDRPRGRRSDTGQR